MNTEAGLITLICEKWEDAHARGVELSAEELCRDHPEALEEVRSAIRNLRAAGRVVGETHGPGSPTDGTPGGNLPDPILPPKCRYRLVRFLAQGGLGRVYVGFDTELNREVAIKFILPNRLSADDAARRFEWEAEVTGKLEHPGVAPVYGLIRNPASRQVLYAMRLLPGETLQDANTRRDPEDVGRFRELLGHFVRVCRVVGFAHTRGFLHRDLKPSNVMVGPSGETWVLDWGLAKAIGSTPGAATLPAGGTQPGQILGTPGYMAPEQVAGEPDTLSSAADIYALGGLLYFLLTGRAPHHGPTTAAVITRALSADVTPARKVNPDAPPALAAICRRALSLKPEDRYPSANAVADEVERYLARTALGDDGPEDIEIDDVEIDEPPRRRRKWPVAVGFAAVLVAAIAAVIVIKVRTPDGKETTVEVPAGSTAKVDEKGGVTVVVPADPERRAAETLKPFAKEIDVQLANGRVVTVFPNNILPNEPFTFGRFQPREGEPLPPDFVAQVLLPTLATARNFRSLYDPFHILPLTDADIAQLAEFPCRDTLSTLYCNAEFTTTAMNSLCRFPRLEWLGIRASAVDDALLGRLSELPMLDVLWLYDPNREGRVTEQGWAAFAVLKVSGLGLHSADRVPLAAYRQFVRMPRFKHAMFAMHCPDAACLAELAGCSTLDRLHINVADIPSDRFREIAKMTRLSGLLMNKSKFAEADLKYLADLPDLTLLDIGRTQITDNGLAILKPLTGLRLLELRESTVTLAGVKALAAALPDCNIYWDSGPQRSRQIPAMVGTDPPPHGTFPGAVVVAETFDDPKKVDAFVGTRDGITCSVKDGLYIAENPEVGVRPVEMMRFGQPARDTAVVVRLRATDCTPFISFRGRTNGTRITWLTLTVDQSGRWQLKWSALEKRQSLWTQSGSGIVAQSTIPDSELAPGRWVTLAGRTSGDRYEVWVNGRSVAWGRVEIEGESDEPFGWGVTTEAIQTGFKPTKLEVDHVTVWHLPPKVPE